MPLVSVVFLIAVLVPIYWAIYVATKPSPPLMLSCPKCESLTRRGKRPAWQILLSILLFPFGLLTLLAGRNPTRCDKCGFHWQA